MLIKRENLYEDGIWYSETRAQKPSAHIFEVPGGLYHQWSDARQALQAAESEMERLYQEHRKMKRTR